MERRVSDRKRQQANYVKLNSVGRDSVEDPGLNIIMDSMEEGQIADSPFTIQADEQDDFNTDVGPPTSWGSDSEASQGTESVSAPEENEAEADQASSEQESLISLSRLPEEGVEDELA